MSAYLSAREAADYCGVTEKTIRNWLAAGRLSAEKSAGSFHIPREQLEPWRRNSARTGNGADRQAEADGPEVRGALAELLQLARDAQTRADVLATRLAAAEGRLRALEAPRRPQ